MLLCCWGAAGVLLGCCDNGCYLGTAGLLVVCCCSAAGTMLGQWWYQTAETGAAGALLECAAGVLLGAVLLRCCWGAAGVLLYGVPLV